MEKKSVLLVNDDNAPLELQEWLPDKNHYDLQAAPGYQKGLEALAREEFDLVICGLRDPEFQVSLLNTAKNHNFWIKTIVLAHTSIEDYLSLLSERRLSLNIIGINPPLNSRELSVTVDKLFARNIFGIEKYVSDKAKSLEFKISDSSQKQDLINQAVEFVKKAGFDTRISNAVSDIADELLMNAIFDAPRDERGVFLYAQLDRAEKVSLKEGKAVRLKCAYDDKHLVLSVLDAYGSLDKYKFTSHLIKCINDARIKIKPGGGGVGVYEILNSLSAFVLNIEPDEMTEAIAIIDWKWPMRDFQKKNKSFHIFTNKEEIKIAEDLVTSREDSDGGLLITLKGTLDESVHLGRIFDTAKDEITVNLRGIKRINSCGVREWVNTIRDIPPKTELKFIECSPAMIKQFNMITNFTGEGRIISFLAPYFCPKCKKQVEELIVTSQHLKELLRIKAPDFSCPECESRLEFDDLEDKYFQFILRQENSIA